ncbi:MAG: hypothetical protein ABIA47_03740 [bacterium]
MTRIRVSGAQLKELHNRVGELIRRVVEGPLTFKATMAALQRVINGEFEPKPKSVEVETQLCQDHGNRCSICNYMFPDGDDVCQNGHMIGQYY